MSARLWFLLVLVWIVGLSPIWAGPLILPFPEVRWGGVLIVSALIGVASAIWASHRLVDRLGGEPTYREQVERIESICYRDVEHPGQATIREILRVINL